MSTTLNESWEKKIIHYSPQFLFTYYHTKTHSALMIGDLFQRWDEKLRKRYMTCPHRERNSHTEASDLYAQNSLYPAAARSARRKF